VDVRLPRFGPGQGPLDQLGRRDFAPVQRNGHLERGLDLAVGQTAHRRMNSRTRSTICGMASYMAMPSANTTSSAFGMTSARIRPTSTGWISSPSLDRINVGAVTARRT